MVQEGAGTQAAGTAKHTTLKRQLLLLATLHSPRDPAMLGQLLLLV
jgi:hypothetical protein